jgi:hypothetical protein
MDSEAEEAGIQSQEAMVLSKWNTKFEAHFVAI